ncbi:MAG: hypothetical protein ACD_3C00015G0001, partial [uncultured bacterium (gcode 4)]
QAMNANIDITTTTWSYIAQFTNKEKITWTWSAIYVLNSTMKIWWSKFPWCDQYDIVIWSQTWAGCNSTQWTWIEWWYKDDWSAWTISATNWCYNYAWAEDEANCLATNPAMASNSKEKSWSIASWVNWTVDNVWWKIYTWSQATQANNACPSRWHLPSDQEWTTLELSLAPTCSDIASENTWRCSANWLGWPWNTSKTTLNNIVQALKIPLWGYRNTDGSTFSYRGYHTRLWSSSASGSTANSRALDWGATGVHRSLLDKAYGFSVRCIKD